MALSLAPASPTSLATSPDTVSRRVRDLPAALLIGVLALAFRAADLN
jgi:hypothetical protein